jgi:hypothetical protein
MLPGKFLSYPRERSRNGRVVLDILAAGYYDVAHGYSMPMANGVITTKKFHAFPKKKVIAISI